MSGYISFQNTRNCVGATYARSSWGMAGLHNLSGIHESKSVTGMAGLAACAKPREANDVTYPNLTRTACESSCCAASNVNISTYSKHSHSASCSSDYSERYFPSQLIGQVAVLTTNVAWRKERRDALSQTIKHCIDPRAHSPQTGQCAVGVPCH